MEGRRVDRYREASEWLLPITKHRSEGWECVGGSPGGMGSARISRRVFVIVFSAVFASSYVYGGMSGVGGRGSSCTDISCDGVIEAEIFQLLFCSGFCCRIIRYGRLRRDCGADSKRRSSRMTYGCWRDETPLHGMEGGGTFKRSSVILRTERRLW